MSYVLDALRRAEAERTRGSVPGLDARPLGTPPAPAGPARPRWLLPLAGALLLAAGSAALTWTLLRTRAPAGAAVPVAATARAVPPDAQPGAHPGVRPDTTPRVPPPVTPSTTPGTTPGVTPALTAMPAPPAPPPPAASRGAPAVAAAPPEPALQPKSAASVTAPTNVAAAPVAPVAAPAPVAPTASAAARLPTLAQLPEALRRELPALAIGGAMDSPQPAARMLIVNGQVFREGDTLAPGLVLRTIRLRAAELEFRGQRFELGY